MKIKAILLILSAAVLLVLCSCKNNNFKGVWVSDYNSNAYIEFLDDKTVVFGSNGEALTSGTYTLEKNVLTIKLNKDENEVFVKSTCLLSQNHLVLTNDEGKQEKFSRK
ncbi:MAG: lipocalin family protein [Oscillospiraceae bacterium]|nr:lipocalin family protein [Oscillospiraceae bacterium]